eukprot:SAG11_NODE_11050_length_787_cov_0.748547_1_plen_40_part_10
MGVGLDPDAIEWAQRSGSQKEQLIGLLAQHEASAERVHEN